MPDLEIIFKTRAELQGAKAALDQVERQIGQAKVLGQEYSTLEAKAVKMRSALANASKGEGGGFLGVLKEHLNELIPGFETLSGVIGKVASGPLGALGAALTGVAAAFEGAKHSIEEFANAEQHVAKLDAALAQSNQLTDGYREKLQELANQFQKTTGIAEEQWLAVLTKLTQFGADSTNIDRYMDAVKNLAGLLGGDVQTASTLFSRAIQGNFLMFARYGIVVDEAGTQTERLEGLMRQLALRGGGQLEAATKGLTGRFTELKNATGELFKGFGRAIADTGALQGALQILSDGVGYWAEKISGTIRKVEGLGNAAVSTTQQIEESVPSDAWEKALKRIEVAASLATLKLEGFKAAASAFKAAEDEIAAAKQAAEIASIDAQVAAGTMSKSEGDKRKGAVEAAGIHGAAERERRFLDQQDAYSARTIQTTDYAATVAEGAYASAKALRERNKATAPQRELSAKDATALKNAEAEREAKQKELENLSGAAGLAPLGPLGVPVAGLMQKHREELQAEVAVLDELLPKLKAVAEASAKKAAADEKAGAQLDILEKRAQSARDAADAAKQQYENERAVIEQRRRAIEGSTPDKLKAGELGTESKVLQDRKAEEHEALRQMEERAKRREQGLPDVSALTTAAESLTASTAGVSSKLADGLSRANDNMEDVLAVLDENEQRLSAIETRLGNLRA